MASVTPALLSANELRVTYGHQELLVSATLAVAAGEKVGLVGRNGSGKTTLLKILSGERSRTAVKSCVGEAYESVICRSNSSSMMRRPFATIFWRERPT